MNMLFNKKTFLLAGLTFVAFLLRFFNAPSIVIYPDSCLYLSFAKSILNGKFSVDFRAGDETILPPLYSIASAVLSFFTGDIELSGVLISAVAGALLIIPVFYLAKVIYNEKAAWICSVLILFSPALIRWSGVMLTESLFIALFVSGIAFCWYGIESRKRIPFLLSGVFIGLAYMTRIIGLVAVPVIVLSIIFYSVKSGKPGSSNPGGTDNLNLKKLYNYMLTPIIIFSVGFIFITGAYLVKMHSFYGHWTLAGSYGSVKSTITYEGAATASEWERLETKKSEESFIEITSKKVIINARNYLSVLFKMLILTIVFVVAGLFSDRKVIYVASFVLFYFLALLLQPHSPFMEDSVRYLSPIMPLLLITASGGIVRIYDLIKWKAVRRAIIPVAVGMIIISSIPQIMVFHYFFNTSWIKKEVAIDSDEKVGLWMKENLPYPFRVMSRKPFIPYYADAIWFVTPATYKEVIELANQEAIDYIVIDRKFEYYLRPKLRFLFDTKQSPADLKFIEGIHNPKTGELVIGIYKINRQ